MANDFFDAADWTRPTDNTLARSQSVADLGAAVEAGFDKLPGEAPLIDNRWTYAADTGSANAYVVTLTDAPAAYVEGLHIAMKVANANTGPSTLNVNGLGNKAIKRNDGSDPAAGVIAAAAIAEFRFDGTNFQIVSTNSRDVAAAADSATAAAASATAAASSASAASGSASAAAASAMAAAASAVEAAGAVNGVRVSSDDTTPGDLETKVLAGSGIVMTTQNGGANETRTVSVDLGLISGIAYALGN